MVEKGNVVEIHGTTKQLYLVEGENHSELIGVREENADGLYKVVKVKDNNNMEVDKLVGWDLFSYNMHHTGMWMLIATIGCTLFMIFAVIILIYMKSYEGLIPLPIGFFGIANLIKIYTKMKKNKWKN